MLVGVGGGDPVAVTDTLRLAGDPAWSPDSGRLLFSAMTPSATALDIFAVEVNGTGLVNLTSTPTMGEAEPDWSPDGAYVVFAGARPFDAEHYLGNMEIVRRAADGTGEVNLTGLPAEDLHPSWGRRLR